MSKVLNFPNAIKMSSLMLKNMSLCFPSVLKILLG